MGSITLRTLDDYARWGCHVRITCNACGRSAVYDTHGLALYFREKRWSTSLDLAGLRFRCGDKYLREGCGARDARIGPEPTARTDALAGPYPHPLERSDAPPCPDGIDPKEWRTATENERKRMIRRLRNWGYSVGCLPVGNSLDEPGVMKSQCERCAVSRQVDFDGFLDRSGRAGCLEVEIAKSKWVS